MLLHLDLTEALIYLVTNRQKISFITETKNIFALFQILIHNLATNFPPHMKKSCHIVVDKTIHLDLADNVNINFLQSDYLFTYFYTWNFSN